MYLSEVSTREHEKTQSYSKHKRSFEISVTMGTQILKDDGLHFQVMRLEEDKDAYEYFL